MKSQRIQILVEVNTDAFRTGVSIIKLSLDELDDKIPHYEPKVYLKENHAQ